MPVHKTHMCSICGRVLPEVLMGQHSYTPDGELFPIVDLRWTCINMSACFNAAMRVERRYVLSYGMD